LSPDLIAGAAIRAWAAKSGAVPVSIGSVGVSLRGENPE
jgi:hypothetical protein